MAIKKNTEHTTLVIEPIKMRSVIVHLVGISPLIMHRFAFKAWQELLYPSQKKNKAERASSLKHQPLEEYRGCLYCNRDPGQAALFHIPNGMLHQALAAAALDMLGATRTAMERWTSVVDLNINLFGVPQMFMSMVRSSDQNRTPDVRTRPIFPQWACSIEISYKIDPLTDSSVINLLAAAGTIVGFGDWRPQKGGPYGKFKIVGVWPVDIRVALEAHYASCLNCYQRVGLWPKRKKFGVTGFIRELGYHWLHFRERWWDAMSGGASIPFAALGILTSTPWGQEHLPMWMQTVWAQNIFWLSAVVCAWIAGYRVWKPERDKVIELTETLTPKINAIFDPTKSPCRSVSEFRFNDGRNPINGMVYRIEVENIGAEIIHACEGFLTEIAFQDEDAELGVMNLFWSGMYPLALRIDLRPNVKRHLDLIVIYEDGRVSIISPGWPPNNRQDFLSRRGRYRFTVVIGGSESTLPPYKMYLDYTGDWQTSTMGLI